MNICLYQGHSNYQVVGTSNSILYPGIVFNVWNIYGVIIIIIYFCKVFQLWNGSRLFCSVLDGESMEYSYMWKVSGEESRALEIMCTTWQKHGGKFACSRPPYTVYG